MNNDKVRSAFGSPDFTDKAKSTFQSSGIQNLGTNATDSLRGGAAKSGGFWRHLFGSDEEQTATTPAPTNTKETKMNESNIASQTAQIAQSNIARASTTEVSRPIDRPVERSLTNGAAPYSPAQVVEPRPAVAPVAPLPQAPAAPKAADVKPLDVPKPADVKPLDATTGVLRLAEEQLEVGKQSMQSGTTRVRRFVSEHPVTKTVTLREEHAEVVRRPVATPAVGSIDWADQSIELIETQEHALVSKSSRIVEEIQLRKVGTDRVETINDKVRKHEVKIEHLDAAGKIVAI